MEPNSEPESSKEQQEVKHQRDANKNIGKKAKISKFHGKDNMTPKYVMSFLKSLKELFGEDYKKVEQVRITMVMLQWKAKVWWGQIKANHETYGQPLVTTWIDFIFLIIA